MAAPLRASLYLWELMVISAILQLGMLPPLAYYFHRVTLAGPFANVPAVLLTGLAVPIGFFTLAASLVSDALAQFSQDSGTHSRRCSTLPCDGLPRWHGASYRIPGPPLALIAIFRSARDSAFRRHPLAPGAMVANGLRRFALLAAADSSPRIRLRRTFPGRISN